MYPGLAPRERGPAFFVAQLGVASIRPEGRRPSGGGVDETETAVGRYVWIFRHSLRGRIVLRAGGTLVL